MDRQKTKEMVRTYVETAIDKFVDELVDAIFDGFEKELTHYLEKLAIFKNE